MFKNNIIIITNIIITLNIISILISKYPVSRDTGGFDNIILLFLIIKSHSNIYLNTPYRWVVIVKSYIYSFTYDSKYIEFSSQTRISNIFLISSYQQIYNLILAYFIVKI